MNDDELGRLLSGAFDAQARGAVGDEQIPPPPRFALPAVHKASAGHPLDDRSAWVGGHHRAYPEGGSSRRRLARFALPLSAAAAVVVLVGLVLALVGHGSGSPHPSHAAPAALGGSPAPTAHPQPAHKSAASPGSGKPVPADWYVERSAAYKGYPYEAHLRPKNYWPAHAKIHVGIATAGISAGKDMHFDDSLTLDFRTGASHIVTVDDQTHRLTVVSDGRKLLSYPVSLGAQNTPTRRGTKVIMEKGASICMSGPGYDECGIKYTQRLTYDGEYLHAAPWNTRNIKAGIDSSNGCTNLLTSEAKRLFGLLRIGDVVNFPNADGPQMQLGNGYGDWNVSWAQWRTGGLVHTH